MARAPCLRSLPKFNFTGAPDKLSCITEGVETKGLTEKSLSTMAYGKPLPTKVLGGETTNTQQATLETKNP